MEKGLTLTVGCAQHEGSCGVSMGGLVLTFLVRGAKVWSFRTEKEEQEPPKSLGHRGPGCPSKPVCFSPTGDLDSERFMVEDIEVRDTPPTLF